MGSGQFVDNGNGNGNGNLSFVTWKARPSMDQIVSAGSTPRASHDHAYLGTCIPSRGDEKAAVAPGEVTEEFAA